MPHAPPLTVIITTSPTPSAPSTELLSSVLASFRTHAPALLAAPTIVVFDTYDHITGRDRAKKGHITAARVRDYAEYVERVKTLCLRELELELGDADVEGEEEKEEGEEEEVARGQAEFGSEGTSTNFVPLTITTVRQGKLCFVEPEMRLGFGLAVRSALRMVRTPYVWVQQHDWALSRPIPLCALVHTMASSSVSCAPPPPDAGSPGDCRAPSSLSPPPVKYIGFSSVRTLEYPKSRHVAPYAPLSRLSSVLHRAFPVGGPNSAVVMTLTPLFFWYDKPHLAETAHYLERVFPSRLAMHRGAFIEDTIGQRARDQMKSGEKGGWWRWATWLFYPEEGKMAYLKHLQGRTWRGVEGQSRWVEEQKREGLMSSRSLHSAVNGSGGETRAW